LTISTTYIPPGHDSDTGDGDGEVAGVLVNIEDAVENSVEEGVVDETGESDRVMGWWDEPHRLGMMSGVSRGRCARSSCGSTLILRLRRAGVSRTSTSESLKSGERELEGPAC
jgi:hypothetical protein